MQDKLVESLSLFDLNNKIRGVLSTSFPSSYWLKAEMVDVRVNASSGHCYLEFIEKNPLKGHVIARARGTIWETTFRILKPYFEKETKQPFASNLKVLVKVSVEFHELYGYSLVVQDIDPTYTLGDLTRRRMEIIRQLQADGVFTLNKELDFPELPVRIAVITSSTAAGYGDFVSQLAGNPSGYSFYTKLFPAIMQGEKTEQSILSALDHVFNYADYFDVLVIIRGGGATSDLNCFDSYLLAAHCAQFPLPVITGIGHERDDTVLDLVAHTRTKTPTAVAGFLIDCMDRTAQQLDMLRRNLVRTANDRLLQHKNYLRLSASKLPPLAINRIERARSALRSAATMLPSLLTGQIRQKDTSLISIKTSLNNLLSTRLAEESKFVQLTEQFVKMASPEYILRRGYSLSLKDGKIVKHADELKPGDHLTIRFSDGEAHSIVE